MSNFKTNITCKFDILCYNIKRKVFVWNVDGDNDITLTVFGKIHFVKYKEQTLVYFGKKADLQPAPKYYKKYD